MNMLIDELRMLSDDPKSWIVVALLAIFAIHAVAGLLLCPYANGSAKFTEAEVAEARAHRFNPGIRFAVMMLGGVALTLAGLFMIANGIRPTIALVLLIAGILLIQTEPSRLELRELKSAVIAATGKSEPVLASARARLRGSHRKLAATQAAMVLAVTGALLAF